MHSDMGLGLCGDWLNGGMAEASKTTAWEAGIAIVLQRQR